MESLLRALLISHAPLTALVPPERIVWNHLPQATPRPAIVLYKISGSPGLHMRGSDGLQGCVVQVDIQALALEDSLYPIRNAVVSLLHGYRNGTFGGILMQSEFQDSENLLGGTLVHRSSIDFDVWARVAA